MSYIEKTLDVLQVIHEYFIDKAKEVGNLKEEIKDLQVMMEKNHYKMTKEEEKVFANLFEKTCKFANSAINNDATIAIVGCHDIVDIIKTKVYDTLKEKNEEVLLRDRFEELELKAMDEPQPQIERKGRGR